MTSTEPVVDNGVNVEAILEARTAMTAAPEAAQFRWRATSTWVSGTHTRTSIRDFYGAGEEQSHRQTFDYDSDHPELFAAEDNGVTPVEYLLIGLAGCLSAGIASIATHRGIKLNSVTAALEADHDLQGILGIDADSRNGFSAIRVHYSVDADASRAEIEALVAQAQKRSAVYDTLTNPTNVTVHVG
ncbi:OsmC family protein [Streptomyces sp. Lzd4kr]|nr:OsmC family protein [Streptomyces sp. Lzd4kr]